MANFEELIFYNRQILKVTIGNNYKITHINGASLWANIWFSNNSNAVWKVHQLSILKEQSC